MPSQQDPTDGQRHRAMDLGPSGFDPHAPYTPVDVKADEIGSQAIVSNDKNLALLAHLLGCLGVFAGSVIGFVGPLIIWLTQKEKSVVVEEQAREALNFQITLLLAMAICTLIAAGSCWLFAPVLLLPIAAQVIFGIIATMTVAGGRTYHYPFNLRLIK